MLRLRLLLRRLALLRVELLTRLLQLLLLLPLLLKRRAQPVLARRLLRKLSVLVVSLLLASGSNASKSA